MGFWPFGREPSEVEIVSRVVTASVGSGVRVRAKLTLHFTEPQRQTDADAAADECAVLASSLLHEAPDHGSLIGSEHRLTHDLAARYPASLPSSRVELASVHVVGDPALSGELRRATRGHGEDGARMPTPVPSASDPSPLRASRSSIPPDLHAPPISMRPALSSQPPVLDAGPASRASYRRRQSSQIRSLQTLLIPPGTPPSGMGQFVSPNVKDAAARLLIGFLRAHDLVGVRGVTVDDTSAEMLASLVPASDAPLGAYEASRASELHRWQAALGEDVMEALRHETRVAALYLARRALISVDVMPALARAVVEAIQHASYPDEDSVLAEAVAIPDDAKDYATDLAAKLTTIARVSDAPGSIAAALAALMVTVEDDLKMSAMIIKASTGA